jgi:hypothetical protein
MLYDYHTAIEADYKPLYNQQFQVILRCTDCTLDALWVVYKTVIISSHVQVKVQSLA